MAVAIAPADRAEPTELKRWFADDHDVRDDTSDGVKVPPIVAAEPVKPTRPAS